VLKGARMPRLTPFHDEGTARLRSAIALVLEKHFGNPQGFVTGSA